jgi:hypothetical protein
MQSMRTCLLSLAALFLGGVAAWLTIGISFCMPYKDYFPIILFPIGIAAVTSFFLGAVDPERWWMLAAIVALPTILMSVMFLVADWKWLVFAAVAIGVCAIPSWLGQLLTRRNN